MAWSQSTITQVYKPIRRGGQIYLSWESSSPAGTFFQIYLDQVLAEFTTKRSLWLPCPSNDLPHVDIGAVGAGEETTSFASSLPTAPQRRAQLTWSGGTYLGADIAGFHVYQSDTAGGAIDYTTPVATITAYPAGIHTDGFGLGTFGGGGFGLADSAYAWTSPALGNGTWSFAVIPFDDSGNLGGGSTTTVTITAPPLPSPAFSDGNFLHYAYAAGTQIATLSWNESPG